MVFSGITNCRGEIETGVAHKYLSGHSPDSTNFNNFNVVASKNSDFVSGGIAVTQTNSLLTMALSNTEGETSGSGIDFTVADITNLVYYIFYNLAQPEWERADFNNDGEINLEDITILVSYIFKGGPEPGCL